MAVVLVGRPGVIKMPQIVPEQADEQSQTDEPTIKPARARGRARPGNAAWPGSMLDWFVMVSGQMPGNSRP